MLMNFELGILDALQTLHTPIGDLAFCFITKLGNVGFIWLVLAAVLLVYPKTRKSGVIVAAALVLDLIVCNGILKNVFARVRPCDVNSSVALLVSRPTDYSFPSGHTASSFAAVAALYFAGEKKLWKPALVLAALIAFSRLYLYVHYPTDILGGIMVGIAAGFCGAKCVEMMEKRLKNF